MTRILFALFLFSGFLIAQDQAVWLPDDELYPLRKSPPSTPPREPDFVLEAGDPFTLPAEGETIIRSFVIPARSLPNASYVAGLELVPGPKDVVLQGTVRVDSTDESAVRDAKDKLAGFGNRPQMASLRAPDAVFGTWTPRSGMTVAPLGAGWRIHPEMDFVVTLHLKPNGKEQKISPLLACWFMNRPNHHVSTLRMANEAIDLKVKVNGEYSVHDRFELPIDCTVEGVFPDAGKNAAMIRLDRVSPSGEGGRLLEINDWKTYAQDAYRFAKPVRLKAGTKLDMNVRFTHRGAGRTGAKAIEWGPRLTDEIAEIYITLMADNEHDALVLNNAIARHQLSLAIEGASQRRVDDAGAHALLAKLYADFGDTTEAVSHGEKAVALAPESSEAHEALGAAFIAQDFDFSAQKHLEKAVELDPNNANAHRNLGIVYFHYTLPERAIESYEKALKLRPRDSRTAHNLGTIRLGREEHDLAGDQFEAILRRNPRHAIVLGKLGRVRQHQKRYQESIELYKQAIRLAPGSEVVLGNLIKELEAELK